ncbi:MAG: hypothetical protein PUP46_04545 [Endozoicomonas sp. (ex Botrylloides leachii)]|nr:hypothetical protein [Endozoicomonas sp. (ex Botrylloides leachii)]
MNIVGAMELNNLSAAIFEKFKAVNGEAIIAFFRKVRAVYNKKSFIHMAFGGAGYHRKN